MSLIPLPFMRHQVRTSSFARNLPTHPVGKCTALAAVNCLRALAGFGFPLFAPIMYDKLGYGKGDTVLACLAIGLGCPAYVLPPSPFLLIVFQHFWTCLKFLTDHCFYGNMERGYDCIASTLINPKPTDHHNRSQEKVLANVKRNRMDDFP